MARDQQVFEVDRVKNALIVTPIADSYTISDGDVREAIVKMYKQIERPKIDHIIVDLGSVPHLSSIIIGAIMGMCTKTREAGGQSMICNASEGMRNVIRIMKLERVMPYYDSRKEALASLSS